MSVKDLISAIATGSAIETEQAFNQVMAEKISARMEDMRIDVAKNMFKEQVEVTEEAELTLEDYSVEEIEEYMVSEDFEQLDELSKTTLVNYVRKATDNAAMHAHDAGSVSQRYAGEPVSKRPDDYDSARKKAVKRIRGVSRAADKLLAK